MFLFCLYCRLWVVVFLWLFYGVLLRVLYVFCVCEFCLFVVLFFISEIKHRFICVNI